MFGHPADAMRNKIGLVLVIASFVILYPGLTQPMVTMSASFAGREVFERTQSILQAIDSLYRSENYIVAALILLFSVIVPLTKGILLIAAFIVPKAGFKADTHKFIARIHKWSMADVFIVGIFVAVMAANATDMLAADIRPGFYYFAGYCIVSLISIEFMKFRSQSESQSNAEPETQDA